MNKEDFKKSKSELKICLKIFCPACFSEMHFQRGGFSLPYFTFWDENILIGFYVGNGVVSKLPLLPIVSI